MINDFQRRGGRGSPVTTSLRLSPINNARLPLMILVILISLFHFPPASSLTIQPFFVSHPPQPSVHKRSPRTCSTRSQHSIYGRKARPTERALDSTPYKPKIATDRASNRRWTASKTRTIIQSVPPRSPKRQFVAVLVGQCRALVISRPPK